MCGSRRRGERGLTLVELLLGLGLAGVLLATAGGFLVRAQTVEVRTRGQMAVQQQGYAALDRLERRLALAGLHLDPGRGEEAFPALPDAAGGDWSCALAMQYRPAPGEPLRRVAWYVDGGTLWEAADGEAPVPVTAEAVRVEEFSVSYYADHNVSLDPATLGDARRRAQIRRVAIDLALARTGEPGVQVPGYAVQAAVVVQNPCR